MNSSLLPIEPTLQNKKVGVLLLQLGSPVSKRLPQVRKFLNQFLQNKRVVPLPSFLWKPLLFTIITPIRSKISVKRYESIWGADGSPLVSQTQALARTFRELNPKVKIEAAMSLSIPYWKDSLNILKNQGANHLIILPLAPQYSSSGTGILLEPILEYFQKERWIPSFQIISDYHNHPSYIKTTSELILSNLKGKKFDTLILSFHSIPVSMVQKGDPYQNQCNVTFSLLKEALSNYFSSIRIAYQSSIGPASWLGPSLESILHEEAKEGRSVAVHTPGFSVECLETLFDIEKEGRETFLSNYQGELPKEEAFAYLPTLGKSLEHVMMLQSILSSFL